MKEVYIIMSTEGGIALGVFSRKGTVYTNREKAEEVLTRTNEWAKVKGYGVHEIITLEVKE